MDLGKGALRSRCMRFMNVGHVPLNGTVDSLSWGPFGPFRWLATTISIQHSAPAMGLGLFIPNFLVSLLVTKVLTYPAAAVYKKTNSGIEKRTHEDSWSYLRHHDKSM